MNYTTFHLLIFPPILSLLQQSKASQWNVKKKNLRHYKILHPSFKKEKINSCASIHEYFFQRFAPTFFHENRKAMLTNIHSYANDIMWGDTLKNLKAKVSAFRARGGDKRRSSIRGSLVRWRKMHPGYA